jgi:putative inorganic carbon (HCO3(-)) transporter
LLIVAPPLVQWKSEFRLFYIPIYDWFQQIPINVGETIHANILAGALVQLCIVGIALALPPLQTRLPLTEGDSGRLRYVRIKWHKRDHIQRWAATLVALLLLALLILTQSRGAYLGMSAALLVLALLRWPRLLWALPLLGVALGYGIYQIGPAAAFELLGADNTFGGADWRTNVWHAAGQALHDFPYTGIGIGNFRTVLPLLYPHPALESDSANHAHNLMLQLGLDLGLPGLFAYYWLLLGALWAAGQRLRRRVFVAPAEAALPTESSRQRHKRLIRLARRHNENWALTAGALAALIGVQVHGVLDAVTWGTKLAFLPWLCLALIALTTRSAETPPAVSDRLA